MKMVEVTKKEFEFDREGMKFAKNRNLEIDYIQPMKVEYNEGYKFNTFDFWTSDGCCHSFCEMNFDKRHRFIVQEN